MKKIWYTIIGWFRGEMHLIGAHSKDALSSFQSTLDNLGVISERIDTLTNKKIIKADKIARDLAHLAATKEANKRIADKISSFLND